MSFVYFCGAQIVWDAATAWNPLTCIRENPKTKVLVLAGNGHAWKRGIPEQIQRRSRATYCVALPEDPERLNRETATLEDTDFLWLERSQSPKLLPWSLPRPLSA